MDLSTSIARLAEYHLLKALQKVHEAEPTCIPLRNIPLGKEIYLSP